MSGSEGRAPDEVRLRERIEGLLGRATAAQEARDPVNPAMIRHWCDAIEDDNPVYTDEEAAATSLHGGIVAPPTMLQAWSMWGLAGRRLGQRPVAAGPMGLLDEAGYTSVVATNCEQEYARYLHLGDELTMTSKLESISGEKQTALGDGYFVTHVTTYRDREGEVVARMRFRMLKFKPPQRASA